MIGQCRRGWEKIKYDVKNWSKSGPSTPYMLTLMTTHKCNCICTYCYESPNCDVMDLDVAEGVIRRLDDYCVAIGEKFKIRYHGGETTLLGSDYLRKLFSMAAQCETCDGQVVRTNGFDVSDDVVDIIAEYNVFPVVSLDGTKEMNRCRISRKGVNTFDSVVHFIKRLNSQGVEFTISATLKEDMFDRMIEAYDFFVSLGATGISLGTVADPKVGSALRNCFFDKRYMYNLFELLRHTIMCDADTTYVSVKQIDVLLSLLVFEEAAEYVSRAFEGGCQHHRIRVDSNGDFIPCVVLSGKKSFGNVVGKDFRELLDNDERRFLMEHARTHVRSRCVQCEFRTVCSPACPLVAFHKNGSLLTSDFPCPYDSLKYFVDMARDILMEGGDAI